MNDSHEANEFPPNDPRVVGAKDIVFNCPSCHKDLTVDRTAAGQETSCPVCGKTIKVPPEHHVITLEEAPETQELKALSEWQRQLLVIENSLREARHQREETGNLYKQHLSEANRQKLRMEKLDGRIKELETQRVVIKAEHGG